MFGHLNMFSVLAYCLQRTSWFLATFTKIQKPFFCLNLTRNYQQISKYLSLSIFLSISGINSAKRSIWDRSTFVPFYRRYRKNAAEENSALKFPQRGFSGAKSNWCKKYLIHTVITHVTWTRFCALWFSDCEMSMQFCFDPRFKGNI